jgi:hypothetical protein
LSGHAGRERQQENKAFESHTGILALRKDPRVVRTSRAAIQ